MPELQSRGRVSLIAFQIAALALVIVAVSVKFGATEQIDTWLLSSLREPGDLADPIGPRWFEEMVRDFTALGSTGVLTLIVILLAGFLWVGNKHWSAVYVVAAVASGTFVNSLLKIEFARARPDVVAHSMHVETASFPSGHSAGAALTYLTLGLLLAHTQESRSVKSYIFAVSVLITAIVGLSRIYLGVHWPTDVLAGWSFGAAWALLCWLAVRWLERHHFSTDVR
jgi:undecaprenyl-diphosphatase